MASEETSPASFQGYFYSFIYLYIYLFIFFLQKPIRAYQPLTVVLQSLFLQFVRLKLTVLSSTVFYIFFLLYLSRISTGITKVKYGVNDRT